MAFLTVVACAKPTQPWADACTVRARVSPMTSTCSAIVAVPTGLFLGDGRVVPVKGLGVVASYAAPGDHRVPLVGGSGVAAAVHAFGVASCYTAPGDFEVGASAAAAAGKALAGLGVAAGPSAPCRLHGSHLRPARLLNIACAAGRSAPKNVDDDDEEEEMSWETFEYLNAVKTFEEGFRPAALFGDKKMLTSFQEIAERGMSFIDTAMRTKKNIHPFPLHLEDFIRASKGFRRLSLEAKEGYVLASSVVEASNALGKVMSLLRPDRPIPPHPSVVPYVVHQDEVGEYFRAILGGFTALLDAAENK